MKRIVFLVSFITILLVSFLGITYSYEYNDNESLKFELVGPSVLYIDVNSEYEEYGVKVIDDNELEIPYSLKDKIKRFLNSLF